MHKYCFSDNWRFADTWNMTNERTNVWNAELLLLRRLYGHVLPGTSWRWIYVLFTQLLNANDVYRRWVLVSFLFSIKTGDRQNSECKWMDEFSYLHNSVQTFQCKKSFLNVENETVFFNIKCRRFLIKNKEWNEMWSHDTRTQTHTKIFDQKFIITSMK